MSRCESCNGTGYEMPGQMDCPECFGSSGSDEGMAEYYFNRCRRCNSLLTQLQVKKALATGGDLCACGSRMFGPSNPVGLEWLSLRVQKMVVYKLLGWLEDPPPASEPVPPLSPAEVRVPEDGE